MESNPSPVARLFLPLYLVEILPFDNFAMAHKKNLLQLRGGPLVSALLRASSMQMRLDSTEVICHTTAPSQLRP